MLNPSGILFIDWGLGDHWRFEDYKIGWVKDNQHEHAYEQDNFLWSTVWHDSFRKHKAYNEFCSNVKKFNYTDVYKSIVDEVPSVLDLNALTAQQINIEYNMLSLWPDKPQLYILLKVKNEK